MNHCEQGRGTSSGRNNDNWTGRWRINEDEVANGSAHANLISSGCRGYERSSRTAELGVYEELNFSSDDASNRVLPVVRVGDPNRPDILTGQKKTWNGSGATKPG